MTALKMIIESSNAYRKLIKQPPLFIPKSFFNESSNVFYGLFQIGYF